MALEHALLVALSERPASGLELTRRFEKSLGFFWHATHQQIYRVLARMESDGWVTVEVVEQEGRPDKRVHTPSARAAGCSPSGSPRRCRWRPSAATSPSSCAGRRTATARG